MRRLISTDRLRDVLHYDPETGDFTWKKRISNRIAIGKIAGHLDIFGYIIIRIDGRLYRAHQLAWLYMNNEWPRRGLDHKDLDRANNKWNNIRQATHSQNAMNRKAQINNKLGIKGVMRHQNVYRARIKANGRSVHLGLFNSPHEASKAYQAAALKFFGEFASY